MNILLNTLTYTRKLLLYIACINLISCSSLFKTFEWANPQEKYETLDAAYITTLTPGVWQPIQADPSNAVLFYLPDGETMAQFEYKGLLTSTALEQHLNGILNHLLEYSPVTGVNAKVLLVGDDAYGQLQATPDGTIIVPLRFLQKSDSEDEIAWLLAHELSHLILMHHDSNWLGRYHEKLNATMGSVIDITNQYGQLSEQFGGKSKQKELKKMVKIYRTSMLVHDISSGSLFPAWQRIQEDEADLLAIDLCVLAGYSIDEADTVLSKLKQWAEGSEEKRKKLFDEFQHELANEVAFFNDPEKLATIKTEEDLKLYGINSLYKLTEVTAKEVGYDLNKTHRNIAQRQINLLKYTDLFYPQIEQDPDFEKWKNQQAKPKNKSLFAAYEKAWQAQTELAKNGADSALALIRQAFRLDRRLNRQSYPRWVYYNVRSEQNNSKLASRNLEIALTGSDPSGKIYRIYITEQMGGNNYSVAKRYLDRAWKEFDQPPALYPLQIKLNKLIKHNKTAKKYLDQCTKLAIDTKIKQECVNEFNR